MASGPVASLFEFAPRDAVISDVAESFVARTGDPATSIELVTSIAGMRALGADWQALEEVGAESFHFFQSFDWSMRWTERFISARDRIVIVVARERGRVVLIWPLMVVRVGPIRVLTALGDPFPQYSGVLIDRSMDRLPLLRQAWAAIRSIPGISAIHIKRVRADDPAAEFLAAECTPIGEAQMSCFIRLGRHASYDALSAALPSRRRRLRRKLQRELEERGPLSLRIAFGGEDFADGIREALRLKRIWLQETGQISRAITDERLDGLLQSFAGAAPDGARIALGVLHSGEDPVAYEIAFHYRGHHYLYLITQAPAAVHLSPSKVQIDLTQAWAIKEGMQVFDLLAPEDRYKRDLTDETVAVQDFGLPLTMLGRGYVAYHTRLRPALKRAYLRRVAPVLTRLRGHPKDSAVAPANGDDA